MLVLLATLVLEQEVVLVVECRRAGIILLLVARASLAVPSRRSTSPSAIDHGEVGNDLLGTDPKSGFTRSSKLLLMAVQIVQGTCAIFL